MSAKEFREYADECLGWAKAAKSDKDRRNFLQMAQAWLDAADLLRRGQSIAQRESHALDQSG